MSMEMTIQWMILCATVVGVVVGFVKTNGKLAQSIERLGQGIEQGQEKLGQIAKGYCPDAF